MSKAEIKQKEMQESSYRSNWMRRLQRVIIEERAVQMIEKAYQWGLLDDTRIADVLDNQQELQPNDITIGGMQMTVRAVDNFLDNSKSGDIKSIFYFVTGNGLDGLDGAYARATEQSSFSGAILDATLDRLTEIYITKKLLEIIDPDNEMDHHEIMMAHAISTLTKATSEMYGARSEEGGKGGMINRRKILGFSLLKARILKSIDTQRLHEGTETSLRGIVEESAEIGKSRAKRIKELQADKGDEIIGKKLSNPNSSAAIEASKYVAIARVYKEMGMDIIGRLNQLVDGAVFPDPDKLAEKYDYIDERIDEIQPHLDIAMNLVI